MQNAIGALQQRLLAAQLPQEHALPRHHSMCQQRSRLRRAQGISWVQQKEASASRRAEAQPGRAADRRGTSLRHKQTRLTLPQERAVFMAGGGRSAKGDPRHGGKHESNGTAGKSFLGLIAFAVSAAALLGTGYLFRGQIRHFIDYFIEVVDEWGPLGYLAYGLVYTLLEVLALPAIPLTMTAGVIFGIVPGTIVVSGSATAAATISFLIARYVARDKVLELAQGNDKFKAIDRAIGKQGFKVVTLLRLSPLLPLALSNYLYGLTSVDLPSYVAGSWLGMLPGTIAYVCAGNYGRQMIDSDEAMGGPAGWQIAVGLAVTVAAVAYIGKVAQKALKEVEEEDEQNA